MSSITTPPPPLLPQNGEKAGIVIYMSSITPKEKQHQVQMCILKVDHESINT